VRGPLPVTIVNPRRGGLLGLCRWLLLLGWLGLQAVALGGLAAYVFFSQGLPPLEGLVHFAPEQTSTITSLDGFLLGELATTHRQVLPPEQIGPRVRQAFLAAEDADFYRHRGIDPAGVTRALLQLIRAGGERQQGGSTITQQLAKAIIGREKTFGRKAREAVLALRLEALLSKDQILWTYLNQVYFGRGAYGVAEAARAYFGRELATLGIGELAYLAGLPQRPSAFMRDPAAALTRQRYVLDQLVAHGWATPAERAEALRQGITLQTGRDVTPWRAPWAVEAIRRQLGEELGEKLLLTGGLQIEAAVSLADSLVAQEALARGLQAVDRRQGYPGPLASLSPVAASRLTQAWHAGQDFTPGADAVRPALVLEAAKEGLRLLAGPHELTLTREQTRWARPYDESATRNEGELHDFREILRPGDVVVLGKDAAGAWELIPYGPRGVQGALLLREVATGYVRALVGGRDADLGSFDRVHQACRQPGSVFKPIFYNAALALGFTAATILTDAPFKVDVAGSFFAYRARNADRQFRGDMLLADALAQSRNIPSLKVFRYVGAPRAVLWAQALGIDSPLEAVDALALGASCVRPAEMVNAYARFVDQGRRVPELLVRRVRDAAGQTLLDRRHPSDPDLTAGEALELLRRHRPPPLAPGMTPQLAYLTTALLRGVVLRGTAAPARDLAHEAAGKTGTTDKYDAWFVGFTAHRVAGVWVGPDDNRRVLGRGEHGGRVALPIFHELVQRTHQGLTPWPLPGEPPPGIEFAAVDRQSGARVREGRGLTLPFLVGTAPVVERPTTARDYGEADPDRLGGRF